MQATLFIQYVFKIIYTCSSVLLHILQLKVNNNNKKIQ